MQRICIGSDHGGFRLKEKLKVYLTGQGFRVKDVGTYSEESCDYPEFAFRAACEVSRGRIRRGVIICKSGIGNSIVANKLPRVRAALCYNIKAARLSRQHNDSNMLVLGSVFTPEKKARAILDVWLHTGFEGGRHSRRLKLIDQIERGMRSCRR